MLGAESGWERLDRELERRVANFLAQHFPRLRTVEVEASQGVVTINGLVNSFYERQLCINCCQRVAGVTSLIDKVEVAQPAMASVRPAKFRPRISLAS
jgi:osmotically-inducible protein OsmY